MHVSCGVFPVLSVLLASARYLVERITAQWSRGWAWVHYCKVVSKSLLCHLEGKPQPRYFLPLCITFPICKMGLVEPPPSLDSCVRESVHTSRPQGGPQHACAAIFVGSPWSSLQGACHRSDPKWFPLLSTVVW